MAIFPRELIAEAPVRIQIDFGRFENERKYLFTSVRMEKVKNFGSLIQFGQED